LIAEIETFPPPVAERVVPKDVEPIPICPSPAVRTPVSDMAVPEVFPEEMLVPVTPDSILRADTFALVVPFRETCPVEDLMTAP
jgi:hypothetical protein